MAVQIFTKDQPGRHSVAESSRVHGCLSRLVLARSLVAILLLAIASVPPPHPASAQNGSPESTLYLSALLKASSPTKIPPTPTPGPTPLDLRIAIVGDSTQDEYQAPENARPAWNWVEVLAHTRGLQLGNWGAWGGSRRTGYEFDWARSGATSGDALAAQVPGVVAQLRNGEVTHVLMQIGINDFNTNNLSLQIYAGVSIGRGPLDDIADNIISAARQINAVAPGRLIVASTQDYLYLDLVPEPGRSAMPDLAGQKRVAEAFAYVNERARVALQADGIAWWDFNAALKAEIDSRRQGDFILIDGLTVDIRRRGGGPTNGFVDDAYMHPGTAISGLFAKVHIDRMNAQWTLGLAPLTDAEIRAAAIEGP